MSNHQRLDHAKDFNTLKVIGGNIFESEHGILEGKGYTQASAERIAHRFNQYGRLVKALRAFANYAQKREAKPLRGLGDDLHRIHGGTEWEAAVTLTDCMQARALLAELGELSEG